VSVTLDATDEEAEESSTSEFAPKNPHNCLDYEDIPSQMRSPPRERELFFILNSLPPSPVGVIH
jgi:hypothetical protein